LFLSSMTFAQKSNIGYDHIFKKYTKRYFGPGFDWKVFKAQGIAESGLLPDAQSNVGAKGIMQLMPTTYDEIKSRNTELKEINDPEWNIAAGIYYDRQLWRSWDDILNDKDKKAFTFGSYNAGKGTIQKAKLKAKEKNLDDNSWNAIKEIAPEVPKWRHKETLDYVTKIDSFHNKLIINASKPNYSFAR
jgi:membrane-bound lytic murein transglycosylase MltF